MKMDDSYYIRRIEELERENAALAEELAKRTPRPWRSRVPESVLKTCGCERESEIYAFIDAQGIEHLTAAIRRQCFPVDKKINRKTKTMYGRYGKSLMEMTEEEYAKYSKILGATLSALKSSIRSCKED